MEQLKKHQINVSPIGSHGMKPDVATITSTLLDLFGSSAKFELPASWNVRCRLYRGPKISRLKVVQIATPNGMTGQGVTIKMPGRDGELIDISLLPVRNEDDPHAPRTYTEINELFEALVSASELHDGRKQLPEHFDPAPFLAKAFASSPLISKREYIGAIEAWNQANVTDRQSKGVMRGLAFQHIRSKEFVHSDGAESVQLTEAGKALAFLDGTPEAWNDFSSISLKIGEKFKAAVLAISVATRRRAELRNEADGTQHDADELQSQIEELTLRHETLLKRVSGLRAEADSIDASFASGELHRKSTFVEVLRTAAGSEI